MNIGTKGVFLAEPVSNVIGGSACFLTMLITVLPELKRMEQNTQRRCRRRSLRIVFVCFARYVLPQNDLRAARQGRFGVFCDRNHMYPFLPANFQNREELCGFPAARSKYHYVALLEEAGCAVRSFGRGKEAGGTLNTAQ